MSIFWDLKNYFQIGRDDGSIRPRLQPESTQICKMMYQFLKSRSMTATSQILRDPIEGSGPFQNLSARLKATQFTKVVVSFSTPSRSCCRCSNVLVQPHLQPPGVLNRPLKPCRLELSFNGWARATAFMRASEVCREEISEFQNMSMYGALAAIKRSRFGALLRIYSAVPKANSNLARVTERR